MTLFRPGPLGDCLRLQIRGDPVKLHGDLDRYLVGESATALARQLGVHRATVFSFLRRAGVQARYRILSPEDVALARTMYDAGQSLSSVGEHFGVADRTVLNVFRRHGIPTRPPGTNQWSQKPTQPPE